MLDTMAGSLHLMAPLLHLKFPFPSFRQFSLYTKQNIYLSSYFHRRYLAKPKSTSLRVGAPRRRRRIAVEQSHGDGRRRRRHSCAQQQAAIVQGEAELENAIASLWFQVIYGEFSCMT